MQIRSRMSMSAQVFVLASHRPAGTPDHVVTDSDLERLLARLQEGCRAGR